MVSTGIVLLLVVLLQQAPIQGTYSYNEAKNQRTASIGDTDAHARPEALTTVYVGYTLVSINSLEWKEQALSVTGWLTVAWTGSITWTPGNSGGLEKLHYFEGEVWRPDIVVENSIDSSGPIVQKFLHYRGYYNGTTIWEPQTNIRVHCEMDLTYYPFDKHTCTVILSSWSYEMSEVQLTPLSTVVGMDNYIENSEWSLSSDPSMQASSDTRVVYGESRTYSKLILTFNLSRRTDAYGLLLFLPLVLLTVLSVLVFILPIETGEKSSYCVAILLAIVLIFTALYDQLPFAKYLPVIVVYIVLAFILASLCIVCSVIVLYLHYHDDDEPLSPIMVSLGLFLKKVSCKGPCACSSTLSETVDTLDDNSRVQPSIEEGTGNHVTTPPRTLSNGNLPNGHAIFGHPPLRRKLTPIKLNRVRPKSDTSIRANASSVMSSSVPDHNLDDLLTWKNIASYFNRLCLITIATLSILLHFVFLLVLGIRGSST